MREVTSLVENQINGSELCQPLMIVRVDWEGDIGSRYYSKETLDLGSFKTEGRLLESPDLQWNLSADSLGQLQNFSFVLDDTLPTGVQLSKLIKNTHPENKFVTLYQYFVGASVVDLIKLGSGRITGGMNWSYPDVKFTFNVSSALLSPEMGLKLDDTPETITYREQFLDYLSGDWTSAIGDECILSPSSYDEYDTGDAIDNVVADGIPGYVHMRLRDSSLTIGDIAYKSLNEIAILDIIYVYFDCWLYVTTKGDEFYNGHLALVFDPSPNFDSDDYLRKTFIIDTKFETNSWIKTTTRIGVTEPFSFQSFGFQLVENIDESWASDPHALQPDVDGYPGTQTDRWVKIRADGLKIYNQELINLEAFYTDEDKPWPIVFGKAKHVPAVKLGEDKLTITADDYFLYHSFSNQESIARVLKLAKYDDFPAKDENGKDIGHKLQITHTDARGLFHTTIITGQTIEPSSGLIVDGLNSDEPFFLVTESNPARYGEEYQSIGLTTRENEPAQYQDDLNVVFLSEPVALLGSWVRISGGTNQSGTFYVSGQSGHRLSVQRLHKIFESEDVEAEDDYYSFVDYNDPETYDPNMKAWFAAWAGATEQEKIESYKRYILKWQLSGTLSAIRNFPSRMTGQGNNHGYTIPGGSNVNKLSFEQQDTFYLCNLYPSYEIETVGAAKGPTVISTPEIPLIVHPTKTVEELADYVEPAVLAPVEYCTYDIITGQKNCFLLDPFSQLVLGRLYSLGRNFGLFTQFTSSGSSEVYFRSRVLPGSSTVQAGSPAGSTFTRSSSGNVSPTNFRRPPSKALLTPPRTLSVSDSGQMLKELPSDFYEKHLSLPFGNHNVTAISMKFSLENRADENWDDQIYCSVHSTLPDNPVLAIKFIIEEFMTDYTADEDTFACAELNTEDITVGFAVFGRNDPAVIIEEIAWQSLCALIFEGSVIKIKFLGKVPQEI